MSLAKHIKIAKRNSRITPKLHAYLNSNDGIRVSDAELQEKVLEILAPPSHGRDGHFHPSQLYQCQRSQIFGFYNVQGDKSYNPTLQNLFNDGHFRHLRWQIMLMNAKVLTDIEMPVEIPEYRLKGSVDGFNSQDNWVFELKGTSQFNQINNRGMALPAHIKQVHAYMMATGAESALIVYECKSTQQWIEIEVKRDPNIIAEIESILKSLNKAIDTGKLPEVLDECQNKEGQYKYCPYSKVCFGFKHISDFNSEHQVVSPKRRVANTKRTPARG